MFKTKWFVCDVHPVIIISNIGKIISFVRLKTYLLYNTISGFQTLFAATLILLIPLYFSGSQANTGLSHFCIKMKVFTMRQYV